MWNVSYKSYLQDTHCILCMAHVGSNENTTKFCNRLFFVWSLFRSVFFVIGPINFILSKVSEVETSILWKGAEVRNFNLSRSKEQVVVVWRNHADETRWLWSLESDVNVWIVTTSRNGDLENCMQRYCMHASCCFVESVFLNRQWSSARHEHNDALRLTLIYTDLYRLHQFRHVVMHVLITVTWRVDQVARNRLHWSVTIAL